MKNYGMTISNMQKRAFYAAHMRGFWECLNRCPIDQDGNFVPRATPHSKIPEKLCLMHSEVSEALEAYREDPTIPSTVSEEGKPLGFASELADIVIRVGDTAEALGIDLEAAVVQKMKYNESRPFKHGGKTI